MPLINYDPMMVCMEFYNMTGEEVVFTSTHPEKHKHYFFKKPPSHWERIVCKTDDFAFLPHRYYNGATKSGRPIKGLINEGSMIGKGNKFPSAPEEFKKSFGGFGSKK